MAGKAHDPVPEKWEVCLGKWDFVEVIQERVVEVQTLGVPGGVYVSLTIPDRSFRTILRIAGIKVAD